MDEYWSRVLELSPLDPGIVLLETPDIDERTARAPGRRSRPPRYTHGTRIGSRGFVSTRPLTDIATSNRILDRIDVVRGFTGYQHFDYSSR